jgi:hypothetical protein
MNTKALHAGTSQTSLVLLIILHFLITSSIKRLLDDIGSCHGSHITETCVDWSSYEINRQEHTFCNSPKQDVPMQEHPQVGLCQLKLVCIPLVRYLVHCGP